MKNSIFFCITLCLFAVYSCKKKTKTTETSIESVSKKLEMYNVFLPFRHNYNTLSFRANIDYNDGKNKFSFTGNFRIRQDSLIWVSFTGPLGIEVARAIITRDSVRLWNKLQGERNNYHINYLSRFFPVVNFFAVQDFLLGNPLLLSNSSIAAISDSSTISFWQEDSKLSLAQQGNMKNYTVLSYLLKDKLLNQSLNATFGRPQPLDNHFFNCERNINIQRGSQNIKVTLDIYKYQTGESLSFPF